MTAQAGCFCLHDKCHEILNNIKDRMVFFDYYHHLAADTYAGRQKFPDQNGSDNSHHMHKHAHIIWHKGWFTPKVAGLTVCRPTLYQKPVVRKEIFHANLVLKFIIPLKGRF